MKYAVCLNQESRFAPTIIGEFVLQQKEGLHVWKGKFATTMRELAEQVNEAVLFMPSFADPFMQLRVVEVEDSEPLTEEDFSGIPTDAQLSASPPIKLRQLKLAK